MCGPVLPASTWWAWVHHRGVIHCGVANGSSPGPCHVVETRQNQGALELALLEGYPCIHFKQCIHNMMHKEDRADAQDHPVMWHTRPKFKASNW